VAAHRRDGARGAVALTRARLLDGAERVVVLALYVWLVVRLIGGDSLAFGWLQLLSEGMLVVFLLLRRPAASISLRPQDWALAFAGTTLPLLATGGLGANHAPKALVVFLWLVGFVIQVSAKLWLGRNFGLVAARRQLVLGGPYRFVRHPMYLGYLITHLAVIGMNPAPTNLALYAACWLCQVPRLLAEERLLGEDPVYQAYRGEVRWRLLPGLW